MDSVPVRNDQLAGVLDGQDPLLGGDAAHQALRKRRFARAGRAGDEDVLPRLDGAFQEDAPPPGLVQGQQFVLHGGQACLRCSGCLEEARFLQALEREVQLRRLAQRQRDVLGRGRHHHLATHAAGQHGGADWKLRADVLGGVGGGGGGQRGQPRRVQLPLFDPAPSAALLDPDLARPVDHDLGHVVGRQVRRQRRQVVVEDGGVLAHGHQRPFRA